MDASVCPHGSQVHNHDDPRGCPVIDTQREGTDGGKITVVPHRT